MTNKIIRSICYFTDSPTKEKINRLNLWSEKLKNKEYDVQTIRICTPSNPINSLFHFDDGAHLLSVGALQYEDATSQLDAFYKTKNISFHIELANENIEEKHVDLLFEIIKNAPANTFNFAFVFNNAPSSPYFPSASYEKEGFSVGLQPIDLSEDCNSLEEWLKRMKNSWSDIVDTFKGEQLFLGIDSSIAPLFTRKGSLVYFIDKLGMSFSDSVTSETYLKITKFIKETNPKPIGLCGLMFPCLEDFELAKEYENGNFTIERNLFLSLHSGLGIDTYPIGVNEDKKRMLEVLKLTQGLSNKYQKPLSVRFVSDGKTKIGERTDFKNQYLKDVVIKKI